MKVTLRFFSSLREQLGLSSQEHETLAINVAQLRSELMRLQPKYAQALSSGKAIRVAVNQEVCDENTLLSEGCEVAFFPPVTGG
jgi:molybdopterin synthase sulfur carrier subunit